MKIKIEVSNKHIHLCKEDADLLFGEGYKFIKFKDLSQPGQYAVEEKVRISQNNKTLHLRILLPFREESQIELSNTDAHELGSILPVRLSGDLTDAISLEVTGPKGTTMVKSIIAKNHIHATLDTPLLSKVSVKVEGERPMIFKDVPVRKSKDFVLVMHIDRDESNALNKESEGETQNE